VQPADRSSGNDADPVAGIGRGWAAPIQPSGSHTVEEASLEDLVSIGRFRGFPFVSLRPL
jgi:hypothetical protein